MRLSFNNFRAKAIIAGLFILLLACAGTYWYFSYHAKTPEYALQMTQQAIKKHDLTQFNKYVDTRSLAASASNAMVEKMMAANDNLPDDARLAMNSYTEMFKETFARGFTMAADNFVQNGGWRDNNKKATGGWPIDYATLLNNAGLEGLSFKDAKIIEVNKAQGTAIAAVETEQTEIGQPYTFKFTLVRQKNGVWRIESIDNFGDFITLLQKGRRRFMLDYIDNTENLLTVQRKKFAQLDSQIRAIINTGNLGDTAVRDNLQQLISTQMLPLWQNFRDSLKAVEVPASAKTLQNLRLQICDLYISYYQNYDQWLKTRQIADLHKANDEMRNAKVLEANEVDLTNIVKRDLSH